MQLAEQDKIVQQKNAAATELITEVATEKEKVQKEQAVGKDAFFYFFEEPCYSYDSEYYFAVW